MPLVVLSSIETFEGDRCVDIFQRDDGTFGFDEFRRDPETRTGWYRTGGFEKAIFSAEEEALAEARKNVVWLNEVLKKSGGA
ncbi:MAG: hypothetical protein CMM52_04945 [Rhodospirillaceae bacterium]|nr:hypothetical protein [Rhodospirillaceae bacterium]|tara:strand:- start:5521 stop:5766 length:246 start_codon:yes stop_codon:yes gene_type:complete